ncbi:MAG: hypothetical protein HQL38_15045 [Alphaproteobacteria bacterium]|nr:hypothetical protein [Alphaproteobacteria bacterium]MBF0373526.1 hypothetical protein [Alphaproteobacteria bacterium]MBF0393993.1 hypothetical protein [Alphaproteobacteria bacterium]
MIRSIALASVMMVAMVAPGFAQDAASLVGKYAVTGTDTDGAKYEPGSLVIGKEASGALSINWDGGDYVGVGQVAGNVLAVAAVADGKSSIFIMNIAPDGSLSGKWWRRTDPGSKGTEVWKKK